MHCFNKCLQSNGADLMMYIQTVNEKPKKKESNNKTHHLMSQTVSNMLAAL